MTTSIDQLGTTLKAAGQSLTAARRTVFGGLQHQEPLTMHELVARCEGVDRASVYRAVALFEKLGVVQRLQTGWKYKLELSDSFHEHHHHATCLRCGRLVSLPENAAIELELQKLAAMHHFRLERHQLELQGVCQACATGTNLLA